MSQSKTVTVVDRSYDEGQFEKDLDTVLKDIRDLLVEKNRRYGDSALNPIRIFSKSNASEQLNVRIDDKLSRMFYSDDCDPEDVAKDLVGYLIIQRIAELRNTRESND
jgi:hypothetical protein